MTAIAYNANAALYFLDSQHRSKGFNYLAWNEHLREYVELSRPQMEGQLATVHNNHAVVTYSSAHNAIWFCDSGRDLHPIHVGDPDTHRWEAIAHTKEKLYGLYTQR